MEKYYFKTTGVLNDTCAEECKVKSNGTMIGSVKCRECEFCVEHAEPKKYTEEVEWIKCSKIKEATQNNK